MVFAFGSIASADLNNGLVAYYSFDGDANDETGNGHHGIVSGAALTTDRNGNQNSAYSFDGIDDYIKIPHHADLNFGGDFSISFWVNAYDVSGARVMLAKGQDCRSGYFFGWGGPNGFKLSYESQWCKTKGIGYPVPRGEWHHVSVTVDNTNLKMYYYLDGVSVKEADIESFSTNNTYPLVLGRHFSWYNGGGGYSYPWVGDLDELRLYNRLLTEAEVQEVYNLGNPKITITHPQLPSVQRAGDQVLIAWNSENADSSDEIMISMKRLSVPVVQLSPDDQNWHEFVLTDDSNDGYEVVTIPLTVEEGDDWHFYVKHVDSDAWDSTDQAFVVSNTKRNWGVPFISQKSYPNNMKESACGPTSVAMLLQYYYPNSQIDMPVIYHAGTQMYTYNSGPAIGYRNLSFVTNLGDTGIDEIAPDYQMYVGNQGDSRGNIDYISSYLNNIWGIQNAGIALGENGVYEKIEEGPLLCRVYAHGNTVWGHFVVVKGIDNNDTPAYRGDDTIYIHDPYNNGWGSWDTDGQDKSIIYQDFFTDAQKRCGTDSNGSPLYCYEPWFRYAYQLTPQDSPIESLYSLIVDTGHNDFEGYGNPHVFTLFNEAEETLAGEPVWKFYYGSGGDWYYPTESGQSARWTPNIAVSGYYRVEIRYRADNYSGTVGYEIFDANNISLVSVDINQNNPTDEWRNSIISNSVYLENGCYVEAYNIPSGTNIDAVKFTFLHQ